MRYLVQPLLISDISVFVASNIAAMAASSAGLLFHLLLIVAAFDLYQLSPARRPRSIPWKMVMMRSWGLEDHVDSYDRY